MSDKETPWTDDRIRWEEEEATDEQESGEDHHQQAAALLDPFKNPDPTETFSRQYALPASGETVTITLRGYQAEADEIWKSTGLTLWRASDHLCAFLLDHAEMLRNKRILELGAGLGLVGILAHHIIITNDPNNHSSNDGAAAAQICVTDGDTDALVQLRDNVRQNCPPTSAPARTPNDNGDGDDDDDDNDKSATTRISCHQLIWGQSTATAFLENQPQQQPFDIILASDIIYAACIIEPLWETVRTLLSRHRGAVFVMAFAKRRVPVTIEHVLQSAEQAGFAHELALEDPTGVWIYIFRWKDLILSAGED